MKFKNQAQGRIPFIRENFRIRKINEKEIDCTDPTINKQNKLLDEITSMTHINHRK